MLIVFNSSDNFSLFNINNSMFFLIFDLIVELNLFLIELSDLPLTCYAINDQRLPYLFIIILKNKKKMKNIKMKNIIIHCM